MINITLNTTTEIQTLVNNMETTISNNNANINNLYYIIGALIIGVIIIIGAFIYRKVRERQEKDTIEDKTKEINEVIKELRTLEQTITIDNKEGKTIKIKKIYINELPEGIKTELLDNKSILNKIFSDKDEKKQPYLLLMKGNGDIIIKKKVPEGILNYETKNKDKTIIKSINLASSKLGTLKLGNQKIKMWIANENEAEAYPIEPKHHSKAMYEIIQSILLNRGQILPHKKGIPKWLLILVPIAIIGGIIVYYITTKTTPTETIQNITTNATNITNVIVNNITNNATNTIPIIKVG